MRMTRYCGAWPRPARHIVRPLVRISARGFWAETTCCHSALSPKKQKTNQFHTARRSWTRLKVYQSRPIELVDWICQKIGANDNRKIIVLLFSVERRHVVCAWFCLDYTQKQATMAMNSINVLNNKHSNLAGRFFFSLICLCERKQMTQHGRYCGAAVWRDDCQSFVNGIFSEQNTRVDNRDCEQLTWHGIAVSAMALTKCMISICSSFESIRFKCIENQCRRRLLNYGSRDHRTSAKCQTDRVEKSQ